MVLAFNVMPPVIWYVEHFVWFKSNLHASDLAKPGKLVQVRFIEVHLQTKRSGKPASVKAAGNGQIIISVFRYQNTI